MLRTSGRCHLEIVDPDIPWYRRPPIGEVAHLFRDKNRVSCPVVDEQGGRAHHGHDVADVITRAEEDLLKMGASASTTCTPTSTAAARVWLTVIWRRGGPLRHRQFEGATEDRGAGRAMPIVASMGGNAGTHP